MTSKPLHALGAGAVVLALAAGARAQGADGGAPLPAQAPAPPLQAESSAQPPPAPADTDVLDYDRPRIEPAGFPLIGGDSDIGVEFGAVGTFTKFGHGTRPYEWNMDVVVSVSLKNSPTGRAELTQQNYLWQIDVPGLFDGALRVNPAAYYVTTVNQGYFSLGNATGAARPAGLAEPGRYFEFQAREATLRELTRIRFRPPFDFMVSLHARYEDPTAYPDSALARDAQLGRVFGLKSLGLLQVGAGIIYDSRDNEYFPRTGSYHQVGLRFVESVPFEDDVRYGAFGAVLASYRSIGGPFILAGRVVVDAQFGNVPFYDLYTGEPFLQDTIIGGASGVRGVPEGRYLGKLKTLANAELRAMLLDFRVLGQNMHLGADVFFDAGRVWSDYTFSNPDDGQGIGIKWGTGAGAYLIWGQAAVFRIEAAYSPDAVAENPRLPVGLYVQDGVMF
ncbi:MAG: outer membrane protein assembly factor [Polyangiaceae bacterium]|nr:outer membrane protein assembly factor [Polyangiaceae bacterium]